MILLARLELLGSPRNKVTITEKEAFVFTSRKEFRNKKNPDSKSSHMSE